MGRGLRALSALAAAGLVIAAPADLTAQRRRHAPAAVQVGMATYYARSLDGDRTASGTRFDNDQLVAAHRRFPFGTIVHVTNLENGRAVTVRIVDRGPYGKNRREGTIIDLSRAAATRLRMLRDGQVRVRLRVLKWGPRDQASASSSGSLAPSSRSRSSSDAGSFPTSLNFATI